MEELATGCTGEALTRSEAAGMVHGPETRIGAKTAVVERWDEVRQAAPKQSSTVLAYMRDNVREVSERAPIRNAGELEASRTTATERGERAFAPRNRVMLLCNERGIGAKNGMVDTLEGVEDNSSLSVRLDGAEGALIAFGLNDHTHIDHGNTATVHEAQGITVVRAHVLATGHSRVPAGSLRWAG